MTRPSLPILAWVVSLLLLLQHGAAVPTWPSSVDELEDIQQLVTGYRDKGFTTILGACGTSVNGVDRNAGAEWVRTAFHDMAPANVLTGIGGLDASLAFELNSGENIGAAFNTTLTTFTPFLTSRSSMADIIAMGVYTAVRNCGGPVVPVTTGRIDATVAGPLGVPLPQNGFGIFTNQFGRMGFNITEMITVTACGHTMGGVHAANFPQIVPVGSKPNNVQDFDTTVAFDSTIASQYIAGTSADPLLSGPCQTSGRCSDQQVFGGDLNVTMTQMANPATFASMCPTVLQKMIEVVPSGVVLTDPIVPYDIKPNVLQLTLQGGATNILFSGEIRVRTTVRPASQIASVQLVYKDRTGGSACGGCTITTQPKGTAAGFDDTYMFYAFSSQLPATSSISAFNVLITLTSGATELHDNNGAGYPVQDTIMLQSPQSCLSSTNLTVVAAVRSTTAGTPTLTVTMKVPRTGGVPVPALQTVTATMVQQSTVGSYTLYSASYTLDPTLSQTKFDVSIGSVSDSFKNVADLGDTCAALGSNSTSSTYAYQGCYTDTPASRAFTGAAFTDSAMTVEMCAALTSAYQFFGVEYGVECYGGNTRSTTSTQAADSDCNMVCGGSSQEICGAGNRLSVYENSNYVSVTAPTVAGYTYQGCYNDSVTDRVLSSSATASDNMTVESCDTFCNGAAYFGVEYGRECYCGAALSPDSTNQTDTDCSFPCSGNSSELCGAGNRMNLYEKASSSTSSSTSTTTTTTSTTSSPTTTTTTTSITSTTTMTTASSTAPSGPTLAGYAYQGCFVDAVSARVLSGKATTNSAETYQTCATACFGYAFFGVEYSDECYCGDTFPSPVAAPASDCSMPCAGDPTAVCGGPNRINVFNNTSGSVASNPTVSGWTYAGCYMDSTAARALTAEAETDTVGMTVEKCTAFCAGYTYAGMEYASECYCGNAFANPSSVAAETDCSMLCSGNSLEFCGGPNRLTLYMAA